MGTPSRYYSSTASKTALSSSITSGQTTYQVDTTSGFPSGYPYVLIHERETPNEELVLVTGMAGMNLVVTRGWDGTTARAHASGTPVEHGVAAADLRDSRVHEASETDVHGLTGGAAVVGDSSTQVISNKTLGGDWDANGFTLLNLPTPTHSYDIVTKGWAESNANNAVSSALAAAASAAAAAASEDLAHDWAVKMDGPVLPGLYSARWYAQRPPTAIYSADAPTNSTYPGGLLPGDIWVESDSDTMEITDYLPFPTPGDAGKFLTNNGASTLWSSIISGMIVSDTAPSSPAAGQTWYDSTSGKAYIFYDSQWVEFGAFGTTGTAMPGVPTFVQSTAPTYTGGPYVWFDISGGNLQIKYEDGL